MKILKELWYGNITPNERDVKPDIRLHKLGALIVRHEETLMSLLSEQAKEIYEKLRDCHSELHGINECEAFCIGFRLGARITYEAMEGKEAQREIAVLQKKAAEMERRKSELSAIFKRLYEDSVPGRIPDEQ